MDDADEPRVITAVFPPKLIHPLIECDPYWPGRGEREHVRYIILHGGRGGSKSWSVARALLIRALERPLRILCVREFMSSIKQSVHKLLVDQIAALGLQEHYIIEQSMIRGTNGSEFSFAGLRNNPQGLKSYEGSDIAWCEEAANISKTSWEFLVPTIRRPNSQIIVTFNAELASDDTYQRFVVNSPPKSIVVKINYDDNPFFPAVLDEERRYMAETDPDSYQNIWLGHPRVFLENAVYGPELRMMTETNRITKVPYDPLVPVHTFWDLGWQDFTSVIFAQMVGSEIHIVDFLEANHTTTPEYLKILQRKEYVYGVDWLPHDGFAKEKGSGRSISEIMVAAGRTVRRVPQLRVHDGINAARVLCPRIWIDEKSCDGLVQHLRKYVYDKDKPNKPEPIHSDASHCADAFRYMAISLREPKAPFAAKQPVIVPSQTGWMS